MYEHKKNVFSLKPVAWQESYSSGREYVQHLVRFAFFTLVITIGGIAAVLFFMYGIQVQTVNGDSMLPTFSSGDQIIINKLPVTIGNISNNPYIPKRLDIVVIKRSFRGEVQLLVKRAIGLPGERIVIDQGSVTVYPKNGGQPINNVGSELNLADTFSDPPIDIVLADNEIFVLGDNREQSGSVDSRSIGPIHINNIVGHELLKIWPLPMPGR